MPSVKNLVTLWTFYRRFQKEMRFNWFWCKVALKNIPPPAISCYHCVPSLCLFTLETREKQSNIQVFLHQIRFQFQTFECVPKALKSKYLYCPKFPFTFIVPLFSKCWMFRHACHCIFPPDRSWAAGETHTPHLLRGGRGKAVQCTVYCKTETGFTSKQ